MINNVIILTHGWTGSSAFTALISQAGYWCGDSTFEKPDYNTYENNELVTLNDRLLKELGYSGDREHEILDIKELELLAQKADTIDLAPYKDFVNRCQQHKPWIWKDPRLIFTIRIWAKFLSFDDTAFIILTRDNEQAWITSNLRRHIQSRAFTKNYNAAITASARKFLTENQQRYIEFEFEDLQLSPEETIEKLNTFLDTQLTMEHLKSIYKLPLYKKSKGFRDKLMATLVYFKNYGSRSH